MSVRFVIVEINEEMAMWQKEIQMSRKSITIKTTLLICKAITTEKVTKRDSMCPLLSPNLGIS